MSVRLTEGLVSRLKPNGKAVRVSDSVVSGLVLRISPSGAKSYAVAYYPNRLAKYHSLGRTPPLPLDEARRRASAFLLNPKAMLKESQSQTFKQVAENWWHREVKPRHLRTEHEMRRMLDVYVYPKLGDTIIDDVTKTELTKLSDTLTDTRGKRQAQRVMGLIGQVLRWHEARTEDFRAPALRSHRSNTRSHRNRVLTHDELRVFWVCATDMGAYGAFLRLALLTAQRREKIVCMRRDEFAADVWTPAVVDREKGHIGKIFLMN